MSPEGALDFVTAFTEKTLQAFNVHANYAAYHQDVQVRLYPTTLMDTSQGPVFIERLRGEYKVYAKT